MSGAPIGEGDEDYELQREDEAALSHEHLPPDLQRAAPEIYRNIRSQGCETLRVFVNELFPMDRRNDPVYAEMFSSASTIDYMLAGLSARERLEVLASSDTAEIILRRVGSYLHLQRTGDADAAFAMLAVKPQNGKADINPLWLLNEGGTYSLAEHRRKERGRSSFQGKSKDKGKGRGKQKDNKKGRGKGDGGGKAPG